MKIKKELLKSLIREAINRQIPHFRGGPGKGKEFGDFVWPNYHVDYDDEVDKDIEENTTSENEVLKQLLMYYQSDNFKTDTTLTNYAADVIKKLALREDYPGVIQRHDGLAYRGMALPVGDYMMLFSNVPSSYKLTASERDKFNISPPGERKYQDPITSFLSITSVPVINFYERMMTKLGNIFTFSTDKNKRKEWDYENTVLRDIPVTDEDYDSYHSREYQHTSNKLDKFSYFDDDMFPNFDTQLGVSDWTKSARNAAYYAMEAARKIKKERPNEEIVPFMIVCNGKKVNKGVFVDLYWGLEMNYPELLKHLTYLNKDDLMLIGDADIERLTVFDNRGMGLKESSEINEMETAKSKLPFIGDK